MDQWKLNTITTDCLPRNYTTFFIFWPKGLEQEELLKRLPMKIVFIDHKSKIWETKRKIERKRFRISLRTNCIDTRKPELFSNLGVGCTMDHFLDAFIANVLSCVTLYMKVEFSTLSVEQGHKQRHCKLDNFATVWRKRNRSINSMLKLKLYWNNQYFATIQKRFFFCWKILSWIAISLVYF